MKSIKPGRGPSMMGGIASLFSALFGVVWTYIAMQGGAGPFALFGIVFIGMALAQAGYNFHNASQKDRFSSFDIVDSRKTGSAGSPVYRTGKIHSPSGLPHSSLLPLLWC